VCHSVSSTYLQSYLDEYAFRYNRRGGAQPIFWASSAEWKRQRVEALTEGFIANYKYVILNSY